MQISVTNDADTFATRFVMVATALLVFALINAGLTLKLLKNWRNLR